MKYKEDIKRCKPADVPNKVRQTKPLYIRNILQDVGTDKKKQYCKVAQVKIIDNPLNHAVKILNDKHLTI